MIKTKFKRAGVCLLVGALAITSAYAWLKASETAQKTNVIKAGVIKVHFDNGQNVISLSDNEAIPMTNEYANNNLIKYTFDVLNDGDVDIDYTLYAVNEDDSILDTELIMLQLNDEVPITLKDAKLVELKTLSAGDRDTYTLLAYINENATTEQAVNLKTSKFHLELKAVQKGAPLVDLSNINSSVVSGDFSAMGNIVTIDNKRYSVLGVEGTEATVLALDGYATKYWNVSSITTEVNGISVQSYNGSTVDNYLSNTLFPSLSQELQDAIVPQVIKQTVYDYSTGYDENADYNSYYISNGTKGREFNLKKFGEVEVGKRPMYLLDVEDLISYFGNNPTPEVLQKHLTGSTEVTNNHSIFLRTALDNANYIYYYSSGTQNLTDMYRFTNATIYPMFVIDLSKLS